MSFRSEVSLYFASQIEILEGHSDVISFEINREKIGEHTGFMQIDIYLIHKLRMEFIEYYRDNQVNR